MKDTNTAEKLVLMVPPHVGKTINEIAARKLQKKSEYVRQAIVAALEKDGVSLIAGTATA
jgi:hypothetical protein